MKNFYGVLCKSNLEFHGDSALEAIAEVVKYAPSVCNTQPWRVICEKDKLKIYRVTDIKSIIPRDKVPFYNSIDMGIFLYFLELALRYNVEVCNLYILVILDNGARNLWHCFNGVSCIWVNNEMAGKFMCMVTNICITIYV